MNGGSVQQFVRIGLGFTTQINDITAMYALALRYNNILYFIREGIKKCTRIFQKLSQVA